MLSSSRDQFNFGNDDSQGFGHSEGSLFEETAARDPFETMMKSWHLGLVYLKYFFNGTGMKDFLFEDKVYRNVVDIFELRRRLYNIQDIESANFKTLFGTYLKEHHLGQDEDLRFHSNFDSGNLFTAMRGEDGVYYLEMAPDTNSTALPNWFHFAVTNTVEGEKVVFRMTNFSKPNYSPSVCYRSKKSSRGWERVSVKDCSYYQNDSYLHLFEESVASRCKGKYTLEFVFEFAKTGETVYFCTNPPYSYENLQRDSLAWHHKCHGRKDFFFRKKLLCYTLTGRKLFYYEAYRSRQKVKTSQLKDMKIVVLTARVHPNEPASNHMLKGFMEKLLNFDAEDKSEAAVLRDNFMFIILPMLNPDGVSAGNSVSTFAGVSLAKSFEQPERFITPESYYTRKLIQTLAQTNEIVFYADFRSSDMFANCWLNGCEEEGVPGRRQRELPVFLANWLNHFELERCK